ATATRTTQEQAYNKLQVGDQLQVEQKKAKNTTLGSSKTPYCTSGALVFTGAKASSAPPDSEPRQNPNADGKGASSNTLHPSWQMPLLNEPYDHDQLHGRREQEDDEARDVEQVGVALWEEPRRSDISQRDRKWPEKSPCTQPDETTKNSAPVEQRGERHKIKRPCLSNLIIQGTKRGLAAGGLLQSNKSDAVGEQKLPPLRGSVLLVQGH
ncbi:unnamed protein product, partial [Amoebophrya sp. A25]